VLGRVIHVNGEAVTLIGVMPSGFRFPVQQRLWTNLREGPRDPRDSSVPRVEAMGRLRAGVSRAQAAANLGVVARQLEETHPETNRGMNRVHVAPFARAYAGVGAASIALTMLAMTVFVLLLGCANVTNLMLARLAGRHRELAVRAALGASRGRLIRQMLIESGALATAGALAGLLLATGGVGQLNHHVLGQMEVPFFVRFELNAPILAATALADAGGRTGGRRGASHPGGTHGARGRPEGRQPGRVRTPARAVRAGTGGGPGRARLCAGDRRRDDGRECAGRGSGRRQ